MLVLQNLSKHYAGFTLGPLDLTVDREVIAVLGPSGSGKTTLLTLIAGITHPDTGEITLHGKSLTNIPLEARNAGLVFQDGALFPHMTAGENIEYAATDTHAIDQLTDRLEITPILDQRPAALSGGEKQRVALARTLASDPAMLLLDEPLSSLDTPIRRRLRDELHQLFQSLEIPVIVVTHNQRTAMALGDRLAILHAGTFEQTGKSSEVFAQPESRFVAEFTGMENVIDAEIITQSNGIVTLQAGENTLQATGIDVPGESVAACIHPSRISLQKPDEPSASSTDNILSGRIHHWLNEGPEYRVEVELDSGQESLIAAVQPAAFEQVPAKTNAPVRVAIPRTAIHLVPNEH